MLKTDKRHYLRAIEIISGIHTASQFHARLTKLRSASEDPDLNDLIDTAVDRLNDSHQALLDDNRASVKSGLLLETGAFAKLASFCEVQLEDFTPTWQILAERHGWRPPRKKP